MVVAEWCACLRAFDSASGQALMFFFSRAMSAISARRLISRRCSSCADRCMFAIVRRSAGRSATMAPASWKQACIFSDFQAPSNSASGPRGARRRPASLNLGVKRSVVQRVDKVIFRRGKV